jgi:hypothetical protein
MSSTPVPLAPLAAALNLADPIERETAVLPELTRIRKAVKPQRPRRKPGPKLPSRKAVMQATWRVLNRLFPKTMAGIGRIALLRLTPEEIEALPAEVWKRFPEGRAVFQREGQEGLECYVREEKKSYKKWKELHQMVDIYILVEQEMGLLPRNGREHPRGGEFRRWVREAQEDFFFAWHGLTYECLPPNLRRKYRTPEEFTQQQMKYQYADLI